MRENVTITLQITFILLLLLSVSTANVTKVHTYQFFRDVKEVKPQTRRVFGGNPAQLNEFPAVCALVDRYAIVRCTGALISMYWVLTAAHCVTTKIEYIKYNSRWSNDTKSKSSPVMYMFRHPEFKVLEEDVGRGMDVTVLHHDIGMVRSREPMILDYQHKYDPISGMKRFNPVDLKREEVTVLGFGRKGLEGISDTNGEELYSVALQLTYCDRGAWYHCICAISVPTKKSQGGGGVCSGDSGGPVIYRGVQIAVTSMGPTDCRTANSESAHSASSVFTTLFNYANLIESTMKETDQMLRERKPRKEPDPMEAKCSKSVANHVYFMVTILLFNIYFFNKFYH